MSAGKEIVETATHLAKAVSDTPAGQEAAGELGMTALTLTKAINNVLLPIAAVNFAFDRAKAYFETRFPADLEDTLADVPPEHLVEPSASVVAPALQGLAFSHEEEDLRLYYLNLLATAMDGRHAEEAHPAYAEIVRQLAPIEALSLRQVLGTDVNLPLIEIRVGAERGSYSVAMRHMVELDGVVPSMVQNWERLGLVTTSYGESLSREGAYDWADGRPEVQVVREMALEEFGEERRIILERGILAQTAFGRRFAGAVGISRIESAPAPEATPDPRTPRPPAGR